MVFLIILTVIKNGNAGQEKKELSLCGNTLFARAYSDFCVSFQ